MRAELLVLSGARSGEIFLIGERATIGTDPVCDVRLEDTGVARFHAALVRSTRGGYRVAIVEGASPALIAGTQCREGHLYHGQKLVLGAVELQLLSARERKPTDTSADFEAPRLDLIESAPGIERVWKSERFRKPAEPPPEAEREEHRDHILRGLYLVGHATSERALASILELTADAIATALHPDRIVIALRERGEEALVPAIVRRGPKDEKGSRIPVREPIIKKSIEEGLSVLTRVRHAGELAPRPIASAPLTTRTERVGAIYLEKLPGAHPFREEDLDFLGATGRIVGLSIERARFEADARTRAAERDRERSRWHAVVEGLHSGVLILDAEGKIELANPAARAILSQRLAVPGDPTKVSALGGVPLIELVARAKEDAPIEVVHPGASEVVLEVRPSPVVDADGRLAGAALLLNDATEERLREARLTQAEKLSSLGEMLAGVAHELNNPLATVLGFAELLRKKASGDQAKALDAILEEAERCRRIVSTLLTFARQKKSERVEVDPGAVAGSVLDLLAHELRAVPIEVTRDLDGLPPVRADRYELQQVFFNLIRNARDAIQSTGRAGTIAVVGSRAGDLVRVEVRDSGPGLPQDAHGPFVPRPFVSTKGAGGTGLGLSIAHRIVSDHGGAIHASAAPEGGARFTIELPVSAGAASPFAPPDDAEAVVADAGLARRILVVDDEERVRELLAQVCRDMGHEPLLAADGAEALALLEKHGDVAAVLSDVRMPGVDGIALFRELERRGHPLAGRLVFLSGDLAREDTANFLKAAGRPVLPKPFRFAQVCRALEDALARP